MVNIVVAIILTGLLFSSGSFATPSVDQIRPNVIFRETSRYYDNTIIKGNTSTTPVDLILNTAVFAGQRNVARGDLTITRDSSSINVNGTIKAAHTVRLMKSLSGYQNDSYFQSLPVDQRFHMRVRSIDNTQTIVTNINRTLPANLTYSDLLTNENFSQVTRDSADLTAFVRRGGRIGSTTINDSDGQALATVVGFSIYTHIFIFQTSTQEMVGAFEQTSQGFGNIFPTNIINYLSNQSYIKQVGQDTSGLSQLAGQNHISWLYHGFNTSLGLDIYTARFSMSEQSRGVLFKSASAGLTLNSVSLGLETFLNDLETNNAVSIDTTTADNYDTQIVDQAVAQENLGISQSTSLASLPTTGNGTSDMQLAFNTPVLIIGQIIALVVIGNIMFRRIRK